MIRKNEGKVDSYRTIMCCLNSSVITELVYRVGRSSSSLQSQILTCSCTAAHSPSRRF